MTFVSLGAIASMPMATTSLSSKMGRQLMPLFIDFRRPPPAVATKSVLDGPGMPWTSDTRPMKLDGPIWRHLKALVTVVSRDCAEDGRGVAETSDTLAAARTARKRDRCIWFLLLDLGGFGGVVGKGA